MITFQPRWVFEGVTGHEAPNAEKIKSEIRRRLQLFDEISPSPDLGVYGNNENLEWKQYFLKDNNGPRIQGCPFQNDNKAKNPEVLSTNISILEKLLTNYYHPLAQ